MKIRDLSVAQKIIAGYLVLALFALVAILVALIGIQREARVSESLVNRDFRAVSLLRNLRSSLLAQERLEQQFLILHDATLLTILERRQTEFARDWQQFTTLPLDNHPEATEQVARLEKEHPAILQHLESASRRDTETYLKKTVEPLRLALFEHLDYIAQQREESMDQALQELYSSSGRAYQVTLILLFAGLGVGGGVAAWVTRGIHRSIQRLIAAAQQAASGRFDFSLEEFGDDEFGRLAKEFRVMGEKLRELEVRSLDANPLTHLPGNLAIERELELRILSQLPFAHVYIDLDHFKAFNDRYGYQKGSEVIALVGSIVREEVSRLGNSEDLVGHIGGDDYLVLTTPEHAEPLAQAIIARFEAIRDSFYSEEDRLRGHFEGKDRFGEWRRFPLMSISIAVICSENLAFPSAHAISIECAKMKEHLKNLPGNNYLIDRRRR